jgi:FixJ family two-component response regulator
MSMASNRGRQEFGEALQRRLPSLNRGAVTDSALARRGGAQDAVVFIIDDDAAMREALQDLLQSVGLQVKAFASAAELLGSKLPDVASCLVLDIRLPGMSGLDVQGQFADANIHIPIIFISGHGDIPMSVRAMKAGAVDFLTKPFRDQDMLDAVALALTRDRGRRDSEKLKAEMHALFEALSPREREVMALVTSGFMNKEVAARTGLAETTVKIHRGQAMRKMGAKSLADLVRMAEVLGVRRSDP